MVTDVSVGFRLPCWSSDLNLGEGLCICSSFHFLDSGLYLLNGFDFDLFWMARHWKPAIIIILLLFSATHDHSNYNALTVKVLKKTVKCCLLKLRLNQGILSLTLLHSRPLKGMLLIALKSCLLGDEIRSEEAIYSTWNRISLLKVFHFLLYQRSSIWAWHCDLLPPMSGIDTWWDILKIKQRVPLS